MPTDIFVHDYLTAGGRKISKSSGPGVPGSDPAALFGACVALGAGLLPFLPDAAGRITGQCTPREGRLPDPSPVFRRLG